MHINNLTRTSPEVAQRLTYLKSVWAAQRSNAGKGFEALELADAELYHMAALAKLGFDHDNVLAVYEEWTAAQSA